METGEIISMLNYPDRALVAHAVERANLSAPEWEIIYLREHDNETVESAAERLALSTGTVKNRYRDGMRKLDTCWSGLPWVKSILKQ